MGVYNQAVITNAGQQLLTDAIAQNKAVTFSKFQTSSYQYASGTDLAALVSLNDVKQTVTPSSVGKTGNDTVYATSVVSNETVSTSYSVYTVGLFAKMDNTEVLFAVSTAISPDTIPAYAGTESTYTYKVNVAVSTTENLTVQVSSDVYALASDLEDHEEEEVASAAGAHGLRYYNDILAVFNGSTWDEIKTGGGGSTLRVFTEDSSLMGGSVSITGAGETVTGTLSNTGEATFEGFMMTGTITVTVTKGAATGTETATIPYYGSYEVEVATGTKYTLNITTTESTLYGKTVTSTYGGDSKTATISNSGTATINIFGYTGAVVVTATDGTYTATTNVTITSGTTTYTVPLSFVSVYGASWDGTSTTSWSRTDDAAGFTDPVPYKAGATSYGSPFDTLMPWSGMVKSTDAEAGTVVAIPKFWYKITQSGSGIKIQIADGEKDGFSVSNPNLSMYGEVIA